MAVTQDERQVLGLEGRDLVDNVVCQLDTQPLSRNAGAGGQTDSSPNPARQGGRNRNGAEMQARVMSSTPLRGVRHPEPTGPRACSAQNKAWVALGQLELVFNSGCPPHGAVQTGQITESL